MKPISCNQRNGGHRKLLCASCSLSATAEPGLEEWLGFQPQRGRGRAFQAQGRICHTRVQVCSQDLSRELKK